MRRAAVIRASRRVGPYAREVGRHGLPPPRRVVPWELLGWGAFACLVAAIAVLWLGGSWTTALLIVLAGVLALGALAVVSVSGSSRTRRPPVPLGWARGPFC